MIKLMNNFKRIFLVLSIILILFSITGCSTLNMNSDSQSSSKIDRTGNGLEVELNLDDSYISTRLISYELNLENTGFEPITLNKDNIIISTTQLGDILKGLDKFKENLFFIEPLVLNHNQKLSPILKGEFEIDKNYFNDLNHHKIQLNLDINYDYKTIISNNINLDLKNRELNILDSVSQAAPVIIKRIIMKPTIDKGIYDLGFYIEDNSNLIQYENIIVKFDEINLKLGNENLNDCKIFLEDDNNLVKISDTLQYSKKINFQSTDYLLIICRINLNKYGSESFNTLISGEMDYNYAFSINKEINLPDSRGDNNWN